MRYLGKNAVVHRSVTNVRYGRKHRHNAFLVVDKETSNLNKGINYRLETCCDWLKW